MDGPVVNVLLIEDNPIDAKLIRAYLNCADTMQFRLTDARELSTGLEHLRAKQTDVVLLDLSLPDSSGLDTFRRTREHSPDIPILVLTGTEVTEMGVQAVREGAADFLFKGQLTGDGALLIRTIRYALERNKSEKAIRESEQHYRQLLAAVTSYTYSVTLKHGVAVLTRHRGCESVTGYTPEDHASEPALWFHMIHPDDRDTVQQHVSHVLNGEQVPPIEHRIHHRNGTIRWVRDTIVPRYDDAGELVRYDGLVEDTSERKEAELRTRYQRDFAEHLVETVQAIVLLLDTNGKILRINSYGEEILGYSACQIVGEDFPTALAPISERPAIRRLFDEVLQGHQTIIGVHQIMASDEAVHDVNWKGKALRDERDNILYVLFTGHDITDLRKAQRQALESERLAGIGQMITGLAHESRNALQRSQSCLALLTRVVNDRPKAIDYIARIQDAQDDLDRIHGEVRDYASPIILKRRAHDLGELLQQTWENLVSTRSNREAHLQVHRPNTSLDCEVDAFRIKQVFRNVLENALSMCEDVVEIDVDWSEDELHGCPALRTGVRDNGPGFSADQVEKIFVPFYTTKTRGTGLGMAIARRVVDAHGGRIEAVAGPDRGAVILITLPRSRIS